jgi:serine/threonine protein phosphatase PrpC
VRRSLGRPRRAPRRGDRRGDHARGPGRRRGAARDPDTTAVAATIVGGRITIGWVGDSRAYWIGDEAPVLLTHDHSWLEEALAAGVATWEEAVRSPFAHALTRCLGPLEGGDESHAEPEVVEVTIRGHGYLVLCTDGMWNYAPSPEEIAALVRIGGPDARAIARALVATALSRGGQDNVTVAVIEVDG